MAVVDTSFVIDLGNGVKRAVELAQLEESRGQLLVSSITVFELSSGTKPGLQEKMKRVLEPMKIIDFNSAHAERAGVIHRNLLERGGEIGAQEAMISATAIIEGQSLITANAKHFKRVEGLEVTTY